MTWEEAYAAYDEELNSAGDIEVAGLLFSPARIIRELDPIAYRTGFNDWADAEGIDTDALIGEAREGR